MDVVGYSERGLLNAIFFTVAHEINGADLVNQLISLAKWPHRETPTLGQCERIMIEQSFSGFGTCDAVLLFGPKETGQVIFVEAKRYGCLVSGTNSTKVAKRARNTKACPVICSASFSLSSAWHEP